jgi:predicted RNA binding protein YcfA (HicA-like mRNA interferase family)
LGKSRRKLPTLTAGDLICVVEADGWVRVDGTKHLAWEHPTKNGKVNISAKWQHVRPSGWPFTAVLAQAGLTMGQFEDLYWNECR